MGKTKMENKGPDRRQKSWVWVSGSALAALFLYAVWPTPYEYTRKAPHVYRVNRFSGVTETATAEGWKTDSELARLREREKKQIAAELKESKAREAEERRKSEIELSEVQDLGELNLAGARTTCSISYSKGRIRFRIKLVPGGRAKAVIDSEFRSSFFLNATFVDEQGFAVVSERVSLEDLTRIVDDSGKAVYYEYEGSSFVSVDDYQRIVGWEPTYNWGE